jgi:hypothetical protein
LGALGALEEVGDPKMPKQRIVAVCAEDLGSHFSCTVMGGRLRVKFLIKDLFNEKLLIIWS